MKKLKVIEWAKENRWTASNLLEKFNSVAVTVGSDVRVNRQTTHNWVNKGRKPLRRNRSILASIAKNDGVELIF